MGRVKAYDEEGKEVWIHDSYLDNYLEKELYRLSNSDDLDLDYWFGKKIRERTEALSKEVEVLRGEVESLRKTKEEKAEEELFIAKFIKDKEEL